MNKEKLAKCGCGGEAQVDTKLVSRAPVERKRIYCTNCYISTDWMKSETEAIEAWNKAIGRNCDKCGIATVMRNTNIKIAEIWDYIMGITSLLNYNIESKQKRSNYNEQTEARKVRMRR